MTSGMTVGCDMGSETEREECLALLCHPKWFDEETESQPRSGRAQKNRKKPERTQSEDPFGQTDGDVDIITLGCNESEWLRRYGAGNQMRGDFDVFVTRGYFKKRLQNSYRSNNN
jgi:hypothetical protein